MRRKKKKNKTKKVTLELSAASNETDYGKLWFEHSKASFRMLFIFFFRKRKMCICRIKRADVYFARIFAIAMGNNKKCRYGLLLLSERWHWIELECLVFLLCLQMFLEINKKLKSVQCLPFSKTKQKKCQPSWQSSTCMPWLTFI